jgi:hypothetical protein
MGSQLRANPLASLDYTKLHGQRAALHSRRVGDATRYEGSDTKRTAERGLPCTISEYLISRRDDDDRPPRVEMQVVVALVGHLIR